MKKITLTWFLGAFLLGTANLATASGIDPTKPLKKPVATFATANDDCANAIAITTFPYTFFQEDGSEAANDGLSTTCEGPMNDGLWYTVEGNGNSIIITVTPQAGYDVEIGIYSGSCDQLECVGNMDDTYSGQAETYTIPSSEIGATYYINVGHYHPTIDNAEGNFTINVESVPTPVNDNCEGAIEIATFPYTNEQTDGAAASTDGFVWACENWEMNDGLWYTFTGDGNNIDITVTTGEDYDISLGVFTGSCGTLECVGTVDDMISGDETFTVTSSEVGTVYYINVGYYDSFDDAPEGNFTINLTSTVPPDPAACSPAAIFPLDGATDVPVGEMEFSWEASTTGGPVDSYDLYGGTELPLTEDDFIDNFEETTASIEIEGFSTTFYWIAIPRNAGGQALDCVEWSFTTVEAPPVPDNDACDTATPIASFPFNDTIDASSATNNGGFLNITDCGTMNDGIWYTVEGNGTDITINATSQGWDGEIGVYAGACGSFVCYDHADNFGANGTETVTITASETGTTYFINFGHYGGFSDGAEGPSIIEVTSEDLSVGDTELQRFTAYPNPVKDILNLSHATNITNVEVFNLLGQSMLVKTVNSNETQVDLSGFASGSYLVKVTAETATETIKVLKH